MATLNTTPNRGYQEPYIGNDLETDVGRIIAALRAIDVDVASAFALVAGKAGLVSPTFTGTPTVPTAIPGDDSSKIANTAFVRAALAALVGMAPDALDTIEELAAASEDNSDLIDLLEAAVALKADAAATTAALAAKADATTVTTLQTATNINGLTGKTTPVDADEMRIADSAASFGFKKLTFANLKAWIKSWLPFSSYYESAETPIVTGATTTFTHGLGGEPKIISLTAVFTSAVGGYSVGERIELATHAFFENSAMRGPTVRKSSTEVIVRWSTNPPVVMAETGAGTAVPLGGNANMVVRASR